MPEITCATCGMPIDPNESTRQGIDSPVHLNVDRCVTLLKADAARWRHAHDEIVKYAADKSEEARESLREAGEALRRADAEAAALREHLSHWLYAYFGLLLMYRKSSDNWLESEDSKNWHDAMALAGGKR